jgi:prepilin-type N-terminal cleavage/methylation domain-containing protein
MLIKEKKNTSGFTLIETIITVIILTIAAVGLTQFLISIQYTAEDTLYESTAMTLALSTLEQMKNSADTALDDGIIAAEFDLLISSTETTILDLDQPNVLPVPIVTNAATGGKTLLVTLTPNITTIGTNGYMLEVQCAYDHPQNGRIRTIDVKSMRSGARTY